MRELEGKIALVTGASRGIGLSTAKLLTEKGAKVYTAQRSKGEHFWLEADFNNLETPKKILSQIKEIEGRLDILVNNAGIMREGNAEETTETSPTATTKATTATETTAAKTTTDSTGQSRE